MSRAATRAFVTRIVHSLILSIFEAIDPWPAKRRSTIQSNGHTFALPTVAFQGLPSTLCKGCGHNSITSYLIEACKSIGVNPYYTVKLSGIGCSSKTPAYFLQASHGFNALHGRMPSVATGALVANSQAACASASAATATRPTSAWGSSSTSAAATCRSSTSSRTTAATA